MNDPIRRREFLGAGLAAGAGLWMVNGVNAEERGRKRQTSRFRKATPSTSPSSCAGTHGRTLINAAGELEGIRFRAVCDIWPYRLKSARYFLSEICKSETTGYEDYREMLDKEKDLDCVIIATTRLRACRPDERLPGSRPARLLRADDVEHARRRAVDGSSHAEDRQASANRATTAKQSAVRARSRQAHQKGGASGGFPTHVSTQWNHPEQDDLGWPRRRVIPEEVLKKYGYADMHQFRNWRHFKKHSAGECAYFLSTQADVLEWFLGSRPKNILAAGGLDYYEDREWPDNLTAVLEYSTADGPLRVSSQVLTTRTAAAPTGRSSISWVRPDPSRSPRIPTG